MEKQRQFRIKENGQGFFQDSAVEGEAVIARNELKGWLRFREFVGPVKGMKSFFMQDNASVQVVSDRDAYPLSPYRPTLEVMQLQCKVDGDEEMADRQRNYQIEKDGAEKRKNFLMNALAFAIIGIVVVTLIVILLYVKGSFSPKVS